MPVTYLERSDASVDLIIRKTFPGYTGRKIEAIVQETVRLYGTQWDSGCRREYKFLNLRTMEQCKVPEAPFLRSSSIHEADIPLPDGVVVVVLDHGRGGYSIEIIGNASVVTPMLPKPVELTGDERTVLIATRSFKSSYGGDGNYRFSEARRSTGITKERWDVAKAALIGKKLLNKAGAITTDGRNAVGDARL